MKFKKPLIKSDGYYVTLDDHCLVIKSGMPNSNNPTWLSQEICQWIFTTYNHIDFDKQKAIKDYIDDLVFALYFNIPLGSLGINKAEDIRELCAKSPYYNIN